MRVKLSDIVIINPGVDEDHILGNKFVPMDLVRPFCRDVAGYNTRLHSSGAKFQNGDVLLARITPCLENGKTAFVNFLNSSEAGSGSTEFIVMRAINGVADNRYVYYLATSADFRDYAIKSMVGTSGRQRVQIDALADYELDLPDIATQKKIADTLSAFDDKIELNRQMNKTLEEMGRALFRYYFIDNPEAKNWPRRRLGEFFDVVTGKKDANYATSDGKYPFFTCAQTISRAPTYSFDGDAILLAGNGDFNVKIYSGKFEAYQRTYVLIPYKSKLIGFLYYLMNVQLQDITGGSQGSVIRFITKGMIDGYSLALPDDDRLLALSGVFNNIVELSEYNNNENFVLVNIRDSIARKLVGR